MNETRKLRIECGGHFAPWRMVAVAISVLFISESFRAGRPSNILFLYFVGLWYWLAPPLSPRRQLLQALGKRHPWFHRSPVTSIPDHELDALRASLNEHQVRTLDLDGATIHDAADLADALGNLFGPITFPADPEERIAALLGFEHRRGAHEHTALIVHDTARFAAQAPDLWTHFVADWAQASVQASGGLMLFACTRKDAAEIEGRQIA